MLKRKRTWANGDVVVDFANQYINVDTHYPKLRVIPDEPTSDEHTSTSTIKWVGV